MRLHLNALAYNLANFLRTLARLEGMETWSLTSLRERLIKTGARLVRHARHAIFQMAEAALSRSVFAGFTSANRRGARRDFCLPGTMNGSKVIGGDRSGEAWMKTAVKVADAAAMIGEGSVLHIGGFMGVGSPHRLLAALAERGVGGFTVVGNDCGRPNYGIGKLVSAGLVAKAIVSHIGLNPEAQQKMIAGEMEIELVPQGTLVERIRAAGVGLGGVLTATGLGTEVEQGKQVIEVEGKRYLLESPIRADFALIAAKSADYKGNLEYKLTAHNFNPIMALAADVVIAEARDILPVGAIPPDAVKTPGVLVDYLLERAA